MSSHAGAAPVTALHLVITANGGLRHRTAAHGDWLTAARAEQLEDLVRQVHDCSIEHSLHIIAGQRVDLARLHGPTPAWLVTVHFEPTAGPLIALTTRQREVARLAASGASSREIAQWLAVSQGTVRVHLRDIYSRLGVTSRVELANIIHSAGVPHSTKAS